MRTLGMRCLDRSFWMPALAAWALATTACDSLLNIDVEQDIPDQTVPGNPLGGILPTNPILNVPLMIDLQAQTAAMGAGPAKSVTFTSLTLEITSPDGATWSFLDSIAITVTASGEPEVEIARLQPVPGERVIRVPPVGKANLLPYVKKGATITAHATGRAPTQEVHYTGKVVVTIHA